MDQINKAPLARLLGLVLELWPLAAGSAILRILSQGSGLALAVLGAGAVASAVAGTGLADPRAWWTLFIVVAVIKGLTRYAEQVSGHGLAFSLLARMRYKAFQRLETLAPAWPEGESSGEMVSRLTADVDKVEVFYAHTLGPAVAWLVLSPATALVLASFAGPLPALVSLGGLVLVGVVWPWMAWRMNRDDGMRVRQDMAMIHGKVQENLRGAEELLALGARTRRLEELDELGAAIHRQEVAMARGTGLKDVLIEATIIATLGGIAAAGLGAGLPLPTLAAALALGAAAFSPALGLGRAFDDLPETLASTERYFALLDRKPTVNFAAGSRGMEMPDGGVPELRAESLVFLREGQRVLHEIDLACPPGSHTCVVGPSGSGKTTLVRLLARFYDPDRGRIILGGQDLRTLAEDELHDMVAYLGQDTFVFSDTLEANLRCIAPLAGDADLEEALDRAGLFVGQADRLQRNAGLRGQALSGGERKRLALARILLQGSPVVILDESFSNLDHRTRGRVRQDVLQALAGRTIIECTHEPEDWMRADRVLRLGA